MKFYVSACAKKSGNGDINNPFLTIQEAAEIAKPGERLMDLFS